MKTKSDKNLSKGLLSMKVSLINKEIAKNFKIKYI